MIDTGSRPDLRAGDPTTTPEQLSRTAAPGACSSSPARPLPAWKDSSTVQRRPATRTSSRSGRLAGARSSTSGAGGSRSGAGGRTRTDDLPLTSWYARSAVLTCVNPAHAGASGEQLVPVRPPDIDLHRASAPDHPHRTPQAACRHDTSSTPTKLVRNRRATHGWFSGRTGRGRSASLTIKGTPVILCPFGPLALQSITKDPTLDSEPPRRSKAALRADGITAAFPGSPEAHRSPPSSRTGGTAASTILAKPTGASRDEPFPGAAAG